MGVAVYVEHTAKRSFACAVDWPGWSRSGRSEADALEVLAGYRARYEGACGAVPDSADFVVVERLPGDATTAFGAPSRIPALDHAALAPAALSERIGILQAAWVFLEQVLATSPKLLRKGPRGGGRDRDDMLTHIVAAERRYAAKVGLRVKQFDPLDPGARSSLREHVVDHLPTATGTDWPVPFAIRQLAWRVLDHAWELQDRSA